MVGRSSTRERRVDESDESFTHSCWRCARPARTRRPITFADKACTQYLNHPYSRMCILYVTLAQLVERTPFTYHTTHDASYIDVLYARVRVCMSNASQRSAGCSLREDSVWSRVRAPYVIFLPSWGILHPGETL